MTLTQRSLTATFILVHAGMITLLMVMPSKVLGFVLPALMVPLAHSWEANHHMPSTGTWASFFTTLILWPPMMAFWTVSTGVQTFWWMLWFATGIQPTFVAIMGLLSSLILLAFSSPFLKEKTINPPLRKNPLVRTWHESITTLTPETTLTEMKITFWEHMQTHNIKQMYLLVTQGHLPGLGERAFIVHEHPKTGFVVAPAAQAIPSLSGKRLLPVTQNLCKSKTFKTQNMAKMAIHLATKAKTPLNNTLMITLNTRNCKPTGHEMALAKKIKASS